MKVLTPILFVFFTYILSLNVNGQSFTREKIDYSNLNKDSINCSDETTNNLKTVLLQIEQLNSKQAVESAKNIFLNSDKCPFVYEIYSWALFRSGEWMESIDIIDTAINIYGANPDLIIRRAYMNLEMAEMGTGTKNIDGNSVYLSKDKKLNFNEENFKDQCYKAAINDFKYITETYSVRHKEIYIIGYIYRQLNDYDKSNLFLKQLLNIDNHKDNALMIIIDNYIDQKKYNDAENNLSELEEKYPKNPKILKKFTELYNQTNQQSKLEISKKKFEFYSWIPEYTDIKFTEENYNTIRYFLVDNPSKDKVNRLKSIVKQDENYAIDILISVLNSHANHGNSVEEEAEKLLINIGSSAVPKVILLMENAHSTCTVTKAASILAEIKDQRAWQAMIDYLPRMQNLPFTVTPPEVPRQIIKFDREKALIALTRWLKDIVVEETPKSDDPLEELGDIFSSSSIYAPLKEYSKKEIQKTTKDLEYTDKQTKLLLIRIFGEGDE